MTNNQDDPDNKQRALAEFAYQAPMDAVAHVDRDPAVVAALQELFGGRARL